MVNLGPVSWRPTTVKWRQCSQFNHHSTISTRQTEYHEVLPSSANVQSHLTSLFTDDGNTSWYSVCRVPMVEWRLDCEDCRHLTVGLHDTGPWIQTPLSVRVFCRSSYTCDWKNWYSRGHPARCLVLKGHCWDWLVWCEYTDWAR